MRHFFLAFALTGGRGLYFDKAADQGGGGKADDKGGDGGKGGDEGDSDKGKEGEDGKGKEGEEGDDGDKPLTPAQQAKVDKAVKKAAKDAADAAKKKLEEEQKTKEAETNGEFQTLYEAAKPKAEQADRLATELNEQIDGEVKDWAPELKDQDPGSEDVEARIAWVKRSRPLAKRLAGTSDKGAPDTEGGKAGSNGSRSGERAGEGGGKRKGDDKGGDDKGGDPPRRYSFQKKGDTTW